MLRQTVGRDGIGPFGFAAPPRWVEPCREVIIPCDEDADHRSGRPRRSDLDPRSDVMGKGASDSPRLARQGTSGPEAARSAYPAAACARTGRRYGRWWRAARASDAMRGDSEYRCFGQRLRRNDKSGHLTAGEPGEDQDRCAPGWTGFASSGTRARPATPSGHPVRQPACPPSCLAVAVGIFDCRPVRAQGNHCPYPRDSGSEPDIYGGRPKRGGRCPIPR